MALDKSLKNVILLGLAFMLIFTAFQTMGNTEKTIISSITEEDSSFQGKAYYSLAIIYLTMSVFNWTSPSAISVTGPKLAMILGGVSYLLFMMSFLIPKTWLMYLASAIIGIGAAMIWTGQGNYLTLNSSSGTISRNSGIFWALFQLSLFIGNTFVYFAFKGKETIDKSTRHLVLWTLSGIAMVGIGVLIFLPRPPRDENEDENEKRESEGPLKTLIGAWRLFMTKNMLLLSLTFVYTGLELGFYSGVYSSCIGYTESFANRKELVGLSGIFIGLGEVLGGVLFGILGSKYARWGRDPIVTGGFILHAISFFIIFLNLPNDSPFNDTTTSTYITSNATLAIFCSFLLGFGDACYNTQIYSMLGGVYADNSASAFAIFKFTQSVGAAVCFFYSETLVLYGQLGILLIFAIIGTSSFVYVEWTARKTIQTIQDEEDDEMDRSI